MLTATVVLVLADLGWLLYQAASMSGVALPAAFGVVPTVLTQTHVGYGWSVAFGGALVLLATAMASHTGMLRNALLWLAVIAIAAGKASLGHAADAGPGLGGDRHADAARAGDGSLGRPGDGGGARGAAGARYVDRARHVDPHGDASVERVGGGGRAGVAVRHLQCRAGIGRLARAIEFSTWGHVLTLKLALVALALVLGGLNRLSALPRLRRTASTMDAHTFVNVMYLEALAMIGVFVAAAVLSHSVPAFAALG